MLQGQQFSLSDVEVVTATVNLDAINTYRGGISSLQEQASSAPSYPQIQVSGFRFHVMMKPDRHRKSW